MSTKKQNVTGTKKATKSIHKDTKTETKTKKDEANTTTTKKVTTTSRGVVKSQFFPNKQTMYSNALSASDKLKIKEQLEQKIKPAIKTTSKTISPKTIIPKTIQATPKTVTKITKVVKKSQPEASSGTSSSSTPKTKTTNSSFAIRTKTTTKIEPSSGSTSSTSTLERPKTATLRKGSIVNLNIAGPDAPKITPRQKTPENYDYEDDFDSYASDFEAYQSSDNSDYSIKTSGELSSSSSEDLQTPQKRVSSADEERKLDSGNFDLPESKHKQILDNINEHPTLASLSDEGFEDAKSLQFVNFLGAKQRRQREKAQRRRSKRGEELMGMIRLDQQNFTLFDMPAVPYEEFIRSFGNRNSMQVASQTGDDDVNEEVQTDLIELATKWTQCPTKFSKLEDGCDNFWGVYRDDFIGSGGDGVGNYTPNSSEINLENFMKNAGGLMINLLNSTKMGCKEFEVNDRALPFSDGHVDLNAKYFAGRDVGGVYFSTGTDLKMLTIHGNGDDLKSIGCVWDVANGGQPEEIVGSFGGISCACFGLESGQLIFAGLHDGTVTAWDLSDGSEKHLLMRNPSCVSEVNVEFGVGIVAVSAYHDTIDVSGERDHGISSQQIISLDEIGNLTIWSLITMPYSLNSNRRTNFSNRKSLVRNTTISLAAQNPQLARMLCTDMCLNLTEPNHVHVATNYGYILHCLASGTKVSLKKNSPGSSFKANCLEACPYSAEYFLAGYDNGNISLYSRSVETPLMTMSNKDAESSIEILQWSHNKPCVFYAKDNKNTIHIWDLTNSDLFPTFSIPFADGIKFIKLSPVNQNEPARKAFMAIVTSSGSIQLHRLNKDYGRQSTDNLHGDLKKFTNYVKRL